MYNKLQIIAQNWSVLLIVAILFFSVGYASTRYLNQPHITESDLENILKTVATTKQLEKDVLKLKRALVHLKNINSPPSVDGQISDKKNLAIYPQLFITNGSELDDPFIGPKDSTVLVMVFSEFLCNQCKKFYEETFPKIRVNFADTNKVRLIIRDLPLASNQYAMTISMLAQCAGERSMYWQVFERLLDNTEDLKTGNFLPIYNSLASKDLSKVKNCMKSLRYQDEIERDIADAKRLGAKGVPGIFVGARIKPDTYNGVFIRGAQPYGVIAAEIDKALAQSGKDKNTSENL